ncbi:MAG: DUF6600 domain-containing protein [Vicinamibacterales bacterium]
MLTRLGQLGVAAACCCLPLTLSAQDLNARTPDESPASLAWVDGAVDLDHDGVAEAADAPALLVGGDRVRTGRGRAEIVYGDGSVLHLDDFTEIELLDPTRIRVREGRVILHASAAASQGYLLDTPASSVLLDARGEYGLAVDSRRGGLEVTVTRGVAELQDEAGGRLVVRGGERVSIDGTGGEPRLARFNTARWDDFERWSQSRVEGVAATVSAGRLPAELRPYGQTLDRYGRWDYLAPYGYVWYPSVGVTWRPYYEGGWRLTRYGWTWHGGDPWSWPTHYYGRWGYTGSAWYWIPARTWGPAWVSWGFSTGYVSWCPLGWDGRPVVSLSIGTRYGWDPWRAWTVIPRQRLGGRGYVRAWAVDPRRTRDFDQRHLTFRDQGPRPDGSAVPRGRRADAGGPEGRDRAVPRAGRRGTLDAAPVGAGAPSGRTDRPSREAGAVPRQGPSTATRDWRVRGTSGAARDPRAPRSATLPATPDGMEPGLVDRSGRRRSPAATPRDLTPATRDRGRAGTPGQAGGPVDLTPRTADRPRDLTPRAERPRDLTPRTASPDRAPRRAAPGPGREAAPSAGGSRRSPGAVRRAPSGGSGGRAAAPSSGSRGSSGSAASSGSRSGGSRRPSRRPPG